MGKIYEGSILKRYIGLIHHPVLNKRGETITTSVTNLDLHDISRTARTYGFDKYFLVTPLEEQHQLLRRILGHWEQDGASVYNPDRKDALSVARLAYSIEESINFIEQESGKKPKIVVTGAGFGEWSGSDQEIMERISLDNDPIYLLFGTGWGLTPEVVESAHFKAMPLKGKAKDGYNHLSVRSAVAIYCDRFSKYF